MKRVARRYELGVLPSNVGSPHLVVSTVLYISGESGPNERDSAMMSNGIPG